MSTILSIADKVACGGAIEANTGKLGCLSLFGTPEHLLAIKKGTVILPSETFDIAFLKPLIQKGTIIPIMGSSSFEDVSAEDTYSTNASGVKRLNLKGLPEYKLMFEEGHEFYRELAKLESYKSFDFIIGDDEGNWMLATTSDGSYKGFTAGHTTPELTKRKVPGGDAESKSFLVQFLERLQWDKNYAILHQAQLDFAPSDIPSINGVDLAYDTAPAAGTSLVVSATLSGDNSTPVEGLLDANFLITVGGATETVASPLVESPSGVYTFTITTILSSSDVVTVDLWSAIDADVTDLAGVLYRSNIITATV